MDTGQQLLITWVIHPLMSAKMKISLISTETDPKDGSFLEPLPSVAPADKGSF